MIWNPSNILIVNGLAQSFGNQISRAAATTISVKQELQLQKQSFSCLFKWCESSLMHVVKPPSANPIASVWHLISELQFRAQWQGWSSCFGAGLFYSCTRLGQNVTTTSSIYYSVPLCRAVSSFSSCHCFSRSTQFIHDNQPVCVTGKEYLGTGLWIYE